MSNLTTIQYSVQVDAPQQRTWEVVSDPRNLPKWDKHIVEVIGVPEKGLEEGTEYDTVLKLMGVHPHVRAHVEELEPPHYARIRLSGAPIRGLVETEVDPLDGGERSLLTQTVGYHLRGGPVGSLADRAVRLMGAKLILKRGVTAQKRQIEQGG